MSARPRVALIALLVALTGWHAASQEPAAPPERAQDLIAQTRAILQRIAGQILPELRAARDARALLAGEPLDDPELTQALEAMLTDVQADLEQAPALLRDEASEQALVLLQAARDRAVAVEAQLAQLSRAWQADALERHLARSMALLSVPVDGLPEEPAASGRLEWLQAVGLRLAQASRTHLSGPFRSRHNKYGWPLSCLPAGSDAGEWEVSIAPAEAGVIDLSGRWHFMSDPANQGLAKGYANVDFNATRWQRPRASRAWQRQGVEQDSSLAPRGAPFPAEGAGEGEPRDGYAWYRTRVFVPASWAQAGGATLRIARAQDWIWVYVNGALAGEFTPTTGQADVDIALEIPPERLRFGEMNSLAVRVCNVGGDDGSSLRPILLTRGPHGDAGQVETRVGVCLYRAWSAVGEQAHTAMLASALSPGAYVLSRTGTLELSGWEHRDVNPPNHLAMVVEDEPFYADTNEVGQKYLAARDGAITAPWILLWHDVRDVRNPRPLLIVLPRPAEAIEVSEPAPGARTIRIRMPHTETPVTYAFGLVRPFGDLTRLPAELSKLELETLDLWVRLMRAYPIEYSELCRPMTDGMDVTYAYGYASMQDAFGTEPLRIAPLPMPHVLGMVHRTPGLSKPPAAVQIVPGGAWGGYWAVLNADTLALSVPPHEPEAPAADPAEYLPRSGDPADLDAGR